MALPIVKVSIAMPAPPAINTDHLFVFRIFEMPVFFVLNGIPDQSAPGIRRSFFSIAIFASIRHGIISVTNSEPAISLNFHAM